MISYQELVASLTEWRDRQGLPTAQTDYLGEPMPMPLVGPPRPEREPGMGDEYAELADSEILSEEPDEESAYGEISASDAYPGGEPVAFPDTEAVGSHELGRAAYGEASPAADQWGRVRPEPGGWDQEPAEQASWDSQPVADSWDQVQPDDAAYDESRPAADSWEPAPAAVGAYEGEVTEFTPPPDLDDEREYAEVMEESAHSDLSAQTWDTEAEAEAVPAADGGGLYEADPYAIADADPVAAAGAVAPPPLETADEGESTMDVDPDEILSADELESPRTEAGEIGGGDDPFAEPPPLDPPPEDD